RRAAGDDAKIVTGGSKMRRVSWFILFAAVAAQANLGLAQSVLGNISGTVTDAQNAVIPGAKVVIKNNDTNLTISGVAKSDGLYQFTNLPIGNYTVTVSQNGF